MILVCYILSIKVHSRNFKCVIQAFRQTISTIYFKYRRRAAYVFSCTDRRSKWGTKETRILSFIRRQMSAVKVFLEIIRCVHSFYGIIPGC